MPTATEETETVSRSQMWKHEDFVEWATAEGILTPKMSQAETIAGFAANRNAYRKTPRYRSLVESHREDAASEKEAAAEARKAERAAKAEAAAKAEKAAPKAEAAPAKATAKRTSKKAAASTEENPFA